MKKNRLVLALIYTFIILTSVNSMIFTTTYDNYSENCQAFNYLYKSKVKFTVKNATTKANITDATFIIVEFNLKLKSNKNGETETQEISANKEILTILIYATGYADTAIYNYSLYESQNRKTTFYLIEYSKETPFITYVDTPNDNETINLLDKYREKF